MLAILFSLCVLAAAAAAPPRDPVGVPLPEVSRAIADADSAVVFRLGERASLGTAGTGAVLLGHRVLEERRAGRDWQERATQLLSDVLLYGEDGPGRGRLSDPGRSRFAFAFFGPRDTIRALVSLAEPRVEIHDREGLAGRGYPDPVRWEALAGLVREAFPGDPATQRLRIEPPAADRYVFVDSLPEVLEGRLPEYPSGAGRGAGVEGIVLVQVLVGTDGRVKQARILRSVPLLDAAAIDAVCRWRFRPAMSRGRPVATWVAVPFEFSIR